MKTLLEIQDEVCKWLGYISIDKALDVCGSNLIHKICNEAAEIYAEQFKPKWISVDERLPDKYGKFWVYRKGCNKQHYETWNGIGWASNNNDITHWMPLPEKP